MKIVRIQREGNSLYPLPADYLDSNVTEEYRRCARVNASRQWTLTYDTREERAAAYISGLFFFDKYYLWPDEEDDFNPMFYDAMPLESPVGHWDIVRNWAMYRLNAAVAPRGFAKSNLNTKDVLYRNTSSPGYSFCYCTSTYPNTVDVGERLKSQWLHNKRILDDFSPEYGGRLTPRRGEGSFRTEHMLLTNRSWIRLLSFESRQRGVRAKRYRLDDPEYDPKSSTSMAEVRKNFAHMLFRVILPMVMGHNRGIDWIGTFVSKRHYLWHALQTHIDEFGNETALDPKFNNWARLVIPAMVPDPNDATRMISAWEEMWPIDKARRLELAKTDERFEDAVSLEEIKEIIGPANFNSEYMGAPGDSGDNYLGELSKEKHGYWFEDVDNHVYEDPRSSTARICWWEKRPDEEPEVIKQPFHKFLQDVRLFMTLDTSYTSRSDSDYKVCCVQAVNSNNDLFILDLWAAQTTQEVLVKNAFLIADKWRCPTLHPESVSRSTTLEHDLKQVVDTRSVRDVAGVLHTPAIKPIKPGMASKASRIAGAMKWRADGGKVKMPLWKRNERPWNQLFDQWEGFNPDMEEDCGLEHDDCIDVVHMHAKVLRARLARPGKESNVDKSLYERLKDQDLLLPDGRNVAEGLLLDALTPDQLREILHERDMESILDERASHQSVW